MSRALSKDKQVYLQNLANGGDMIARALLELAQDFKITLGVLSAGVIPLTGQLVDGVGNPVFKTADVMVTLETTSSGSITVTTGTSKVAAPDQVWLQTNAQGLFVVNIANPTPGELSLVIVQSPDGLNSFNELQF